MFKISLIAVVFLISSQLFADANRWIDIEWDKVPDAKEYEVELFLEEDGSSYSRGKFKVDSPHWSNTVFPGNYSLRIRSIDARGVPGEWTDKFPVKVKILNPTLVRPTKVEKVSDTFVKFEWLPVKDATGYQLIVRDGNKKVIHQSTINETSESVYIKSLGAYSWTAFALGQGEAALPKDEWSEKSFITFERVGGELEAPQVQTKVAKNVELSWRPVNDAQVYEIDFMPDPQSNLKNRRFRIKKTKFNFPLKYIPQGGSTVTVRSIAPQYKDSIKSTIKIYRDGETITASGVEVARANVEMRPPSELFWANQLFLNGSFSSYSYSSKNHKTDTKLDQDDLTGLGFGAEWIIQKTPVANKHKMEAGAQFLSTKAVDVVQARLSYQYLWSYSSYTKMWSAGLGGSFMSLPSIMGNRMTGKVEGDSTPSLGPEVSLTLIDPLSLKWHLQADLTYALHIIGKPDPFSWLRFQGRFLNYYSTNKAYYFGAEYQRWEQKFDSKDFLMNGWALIAGGKWGW